MKDVESGMVSGSFHEGMDNAQNSYIPASRNERKGSSAVNMDGQTQVQHPSRPLVAPAGGYTETK